VWLDVTERVKAEKEIDRYVSEMERMVDERTAELKEMNEEMEAFTYSVSHDLRAPLRSMQGFSKALLEDHADVLDEVGIDYALRIRTAAERMDMLILDLLSYSRLSRAELEPEVVDLDEVIDEGLMQQQELF